MALTDDPWAGARERAKRDVAAALAPRFRTCPACGEEELTASRTCPHCGASYTVVAQRRRVPRRAIVAGAGVATTAALLVVLVIAPAVDEDKRAGAAAEQQRLDAARDARYAALREEQRAVTGRGSRPEGPPTVASRQALLSDVEAAIRSDARARAEAGRLRGPIRSVHCDPYPPSAGATGAETRLTQRVGRYECLAVTRRIRPTDTNRAGAIGHPYLARIDFAAFRYAFCKVSPPPGEKAIPDPGWPGVPAACSAP